MLQEQVIALEEQNRNLRKQGPENQPSRDGEDDGAMLRDDASVVHDALAYLGRKGDPVPRVVPQTPELMRQAIRTSLIGDNRDTWLVREAVWKTMGLIPEGADLLASFEDMILELYPVLPDRETGTLLLLEGASPHLGQLVPALGAMFDDGKTPWGDENNGKNDAFWLAGVARSLGSGLQARTAAVLAAPTSANPMSDDLFEPRFFRAPVAVRELFRLLPQAGVFALQGKPSNKGEAKLIPVPDNVPRPQDVEVHGLRPVWDGTWGSILTRLLLKQFLPEAAAVSASRGLAGDRVIAFPDSTPEGDCLQLLWSSRWNTSDEAGEFFEALRLFFSNSVGEPKSDDGAQDGRLFFVAAENRLIDIRFTSDRTGVTMISAANARWREGLSALSAEIQP